MEPGMTSSNGPSVDSSRAPLGSQTNSSSPRSSFSESKHVRRKAAFIRRVDSSEEPPSLHDSLFDAEYLSPASASEDSVERTEAWRIPALPFHQKVATHIDRKAQDENEKKEKPLSVPDTTPILYGHGTALSTIIEQRSIISIRTSTSNLSKARSTSDLSSLYASSQPFKHKDSFELSSMVSLRSPRRLQSFSTDDIEFIKRAYHDACTSIEQNNDRPVDMDEIYAQPRTPILPPLNRPSTPPGMPSWTAAQIPRQVTPFHSRWSMARNRERLRRFLRIDAESIELSSRVSAPPTPRRFRPTRTGYGMGPTQMHPFLRDISLTDKGVGPTPPPPTPEPQTPISSRHSNRSQGPHRLRKQRGKRRRGQTVGSSPLRATSNYETTDHNTLRVHIHGNTGSLAGSPHLTLTDSHDALLTPTVSGTGRATLQTLTPVPSTTSPNSILASSPSQPLLRSPASSNVASRQPLEADPFISHCTCLQCSLHRFIELVDHCWELSARWCCWWCCGVDIDDVENDQERPRLVSCPAGSLCGKVKIIKRRGTVTDRTPVVLF